MLEKLLELLLSAKSGAVAAVFLIGTTGALVTATVQNGVTTITVTPNVSASPNATTSPTETATASPTATATSTPSSSPSSSSSSSANCSDAAHTMAAALQEVNGAYAQYHSALERGREKARTSALRTDLVNADNLLKQIRTQADQKIHSLFTCAGGRDESTSNEDQNKSNEDEDTDEESASGSPTATATTVPTATPTASTAPSSAPLVTGNDAKSVADDAVAAMKLVFDTVSAELQSAAPAPTHRPESTNTGFGRDSKHGDDHD